MAIPAASEEQRGCGPMNSMDVSQRVALSVVHLRSWHLRLGGQSLGTSFQICADKEDQLSSQGFPGTSSTEHLRENLGAASLRIPSEVIARLDSVGGVS